MELFERKGACAPAANRIRSAAGACLVGECVLLSTLLAGAVRGRCEQGDHRERECQREASSDEEIRRVVAEAGHDRLGRTLHDVAVRQQHAVGVLAGRDESLYRHQDTHQKGGACEEQHAGAELALVRRANREEEHGREGQAEGQHGHKLDVHGLPFKGQILQEGFSQDTIYYNKKLMFCQ